MKRILFLLIMISCIMIFVGCATKTGYWKPGTDFDDTLTPEQYSVLTDEEKAEYAEVEYKEVDSVFFGKLQTGIKSVETVYDDNREYIPEPFGTAGALILGALSTFVTYLSKKKVVTKIKKTAVETAKGIQAYKDGTVSDLSTALSMAQSDDTKTTIAEWKADGTVPKAIIETVETPVEETVTAPVTV